MLDIILTQSIYDIISKDTFQLPLDKFKDFMKDNADEFPTYINYTLKDYLVFLTLTDKITDEFNARILFFSFAHAYYQQMLYSIINFEDNKWTRNY